MAVTIQRLKDAVKLAVTSAAESVYQQLEDRFPPTSVGEALSIIDPRFWLTSPAMEVVLAAIKAIKKVYGEPIKSNLDATEANTRLVMRYCSSDVW